MAVLSSFYTDVARLCLCHAVPPTAVGGAHNSPIANDIEECVSDLVHYRLHLYNPGGLFFFSYW